MIATLFGTVSEKLGESLVLELGGVGYELLVTADDWGATSVGAKTRFYIYEQIREDAHNLYGFSELSKKQLFVELLSVGGVGPKGALSILSAAGEDRLRQAVSLGDPELLRGITGVGPKTAQRIVIELKGKVASGSLTAPVSDATYQALVGLGYTQGQASAAVAAIPDSVTADQDRIKHALKVMSK